MFQYGERNITAALQFITDVTFPSRSFQGRPVDRVLVLTSVGPYGYTQFAAAVKVSIDPLKIQI